jgi:hypothetical protein
MQRGVGKSDWGNPNLKNNKHAPSTQEELAEHEVRPGISSQKQNCQRKIFIKIFR